jgi:hypothetical protein
MKAGLLAACLLALAPLLASGQAAQVNTSHVGAINDLVYDKARGLLFSAGEDGTVRIWEPSGRLRACLRVSSRPVQRLALHPRLPQFAALVGGALNTDTLAAWDWERGRELYSLGSPSRLLHLAYAPQGGYLAFSREDFRSLAAVDAEDGHPLGLFGTGFGIVSWFVVSRGENTVMGYQPSGWITYWDVTGNRRLRQLRTLADLSQLQITPSNRYVLAMAADRLVAVDLLSGALSGGDAVPGLSRIALSPDGEEVAGVSDPSGAQTGAEAPGAFQWWRFTAAGLERTRSAAAQPGQLTVTAAAYGEAGLYTGDREGSIELESGDGSAQVIARNVLQPVSALAFQGNSAAVAIPSGVLVFRSDFLAGAPLGSSGVSFREYPSPFAGPIGLTFLDERRLLVWTRGEEPGAIASLDLESGVSRILQVVFDSSLKQVSLTPRGLIVVERNGLCRVLDPNSLETRFRYKAGAVNRLVFTRGELLVGGGAAAFGSPLFQINARTGETVPIRDPSSYVYDVLYDPSRAALFCLEVEQQAEGMRTVLAMYSGRQFESRRVLASCAGEDTGASLAEDAAGRVYCSLGAGSPLMWDGLRLASLQSFGQAARRLVVHGDELFAANTDSTLSIWDTASLAAPAQVCLLPEGNWALLDPQGQWYASAGAWNYLTVNRAPGSP